MPHINGHALAGGCIVAIAADHRMMADGNGTIGMPELRVGVPVPSMALEMVRQVSGRNADRILYRGERFAPNKARKLGLVDEVEDGDKLLDAAVASAEDLASIDQAVFQVTKWQLREQVFLRLHELEDEEQEVERLWMEPECRDRIQAYLDKTLKSG